MHLHILGICGTFMGGLAALAREAGHVVTGCDTGVYPPMSDQLRAMGITLVEGYGAGQLDLRPDVFVVGNVVSRARLADGSPRYPLMEAILEAGVPYTSGPQWLAEHVLQGRHVLAVAGTHGKTTTTSMLAWILEQAGREPGFLVGGVPLNFGVSARLGNVAPTLPASRGSLAPEGALAALGRPGGGSAPQGGRPLFVIEADEYDTAFFDKRSKFVHYRPRTAVLNNLEFDHADIFDDLAAIERQFHHLLRTVPASGRVIYNGLEESLARVLHAGCWSEQRSFGAAVSDWTAEGEPHDFAVLHRGRRVGAVRWGLSGVHNQLNALAAIAAAEHVGVDPAAAAASLATFQNVRRRMEVRGQVTLPATEGAPVTVYDDFAHHPTAIRTTIDGLRRRVGNARILAIFEPRTNTMKLGAMKAQLPWSLEQADLAFCHAGGLDWDAAAALQPLGARAQVAGDIATLVRQVVAAARPGDHLLCMSNGGFGGVHARLLEALAAKARSRGGAVSLLPLLDAALRGAVLALLLLAAAVVGLRRLRGPAAAVAVAMALGLSVQVVASTPWFEVQVPPLWQAPLVGVSVANAVLFWIFACTLFIDGFRPRALHWAAWAGAALLGLLNCAVFSASSHAAAPFLLAAQRLVAPVAAVLAAWAAVAHWRSDLVEWRRRLRVFIVAAGTAYTLVQVVLRMASPGGRLSGAAALFDVLALLVIAAAAAWDQVLSLPVAARPAGPERAPAQDAWAPLEDVSAAVEPSPPADAPAPDPAQERLAEALERAMGQQQAYRSEDLSIASLAARLAVPEYRLRRLINQRLGHRNFNAFVNGYRLAAARAALADPLRRHLPILSIALDAGFQSIGPFNRAFKADTGLTPSEFRAQHLADSGIGQPQAAA